MTDAPLRIAIFDVDGTLIDSRAEIVAAMREAFEAAGYPPPAPDAVVALVGLGLTEVVARLAPGLPPADAQRLTLACQRTFISRRARGADFETPMFAGAREALDRLAAGPTLLGVATGKPRRGLEHVLTTHGLRGLFQTTQTVSEAPGKPHPGMVENCLADTGVDARRAVVIGDTSFDMEMARAAGAQAVGVAWGSHAADTLREAGAALVIDTFDALDDALAQLWRL